jgi:hypothetical protein
LLGRGCSQCCNYEQIEYQMLHNLSLLLIPMTSE